MKKQIIAVLAAAACTFTACGNQGEEQVTSVEITAAQTEATELSKETVLPDGWTMDELRNILIINGKTLTLPTTLNKIMELDENFSYEAEYVDEKSELYQGEKGFYIDILYAGQSMFMTVFASDEDDVQKVLDESLYNVSFNNKNCENTNIIINTSCGLIFTSTYEDIVKVFGEPNTYNSQDSIKTYEFYDGLYEYCIEFSINSDNLISRIRVKCKSINGGQ